MLVSEIMKIVHADFEYNYTEGWENEFKNKNFYIYHVNNYIKTCGYLRFL
jgi:hypothetical protein